MKSKRRRKLYFEPRQIGNFGLTEGKNDILRQVISFKNRFLHLAEVAFSVVKKHKMNIQVVRKSH
jgi:hypothetical protein